jgi:hypothetical protein
MTKFRAILAAALHWQVICGGYALMAAFTYGHSATRYHVCTSRVTEKEVPCPVITVAGNAFFAAVAWPFYWSWQIQAELGQ